VYSVDIDVGGTLTDGIFSDGARSVCAKVDTTPHDLTICLFDCLTQGGERLGFSDLSSFLEQVELLRWSTTITSNVVAELRGPRIGLIVSQGHEQDLYGKAAVSPIVNHVVAPNNIIGFQNPDGVEILNTVRSLLEAGVRRICIVWEVPSRTQSRSSTLSESLRSSTPITFWARSPCSPAATFARTATT
jgi:N-methylhydantoinase A